MTYHNACSNAALAAQVERCIKLVQLLVCGVQLNTDDIQSLKTTCDSTQNQLATLSGDFVTSFSKLSRRMVTDLTAEIRKSRDSASSVESIDIDAEAIHHRLDNLFREVREIKVRYCCFEPRNQYLRPIQEAVGQQQMSSSSSSRKRKEMVHNDSVEGSPLDLVRAELIKMQENGSIKLTPMSDDAKEPLAEGGFYALFSDVRKTNPVCEMSYNNGVRHVQTVYGLKLHNLKNIRGGQKVVSFPSTSCVSNKHKRVATNVADN